MADISKIVLPDGVEYNIKDTTARSNSGVTGVKGNAESSYRTGQVNLTANNLQAVSLGYGTAIATNANLNTIMTLGNYHCAADATCQTLTNKPEGLINAFTMKVGYSTGTGYTYQEIVRYTDGRRWYRMNTSTTNTSTWNTWIEYAPSTELPLKVSLVANTNIPANSDLNDTTFLKVGSYAMTLNVNAPTITNKPSDLNSAFMMNVYSPLSGASTAFVVEGNWLYRIQEITSHMGLQRWVRMCSTDGSGNWGYAAWTKIYPKTDLSIATGTLAVANGGTGQTTAKNAANSFMNALGTGSSTPVDADYYISQYVGGGTTTTTYHRRPMSALWEYVKGKISSILGLTATNYGGTAAKATADASGNTITTYYAPKSTAVTNVALATNKITKTINGTTTDVVTAATTSAYGITKLNSATNSTSTTEAATPNAVKTAYDLATTANGTANSALSGVTGTLIYDHTYTISNGTATFTAHVYCKGEEVTSNYADSCFSWSYRLDSNVTSTPSTVSLGTGKTKAITVSTLGYGGHVIGTFTPPS